MYLYVIPYFCIGFMCGWAVLEEFETKQKEKKEPPISRTASMGIVLLVTVVYPLLYLARIFNKLNSKD